MIRRFLLWFCDICTYKEAQSWCGRCLMPPDSTRNRKAPAYDGGFVFGRLPDRADAGSSPELLLASPSVLDLRGQ